jgi:hypothetical protein
MAATMMAMSRRMAVVMAVMVAGSLVGVDVVAGVSHRRAAR